LKGGYLSRLENRNRILLLGIIEAVRLRVARPEFRVIVRLELQLLQDRREAPDVLAESNASLKSSSSITTALILCN
jgi:hypothetical protein